MELIQMRATREEVESLGIELINKSMYDFIVCNYLCNEQDGAFYMDNKTSIRKTYETFNKEIFLKACDMEEKFEVTKETILKYNMKDEFPEYFKVELKVGEWYKSTISNCIAKILSLKESDFMAYGFNDDGNWVESKDQWTSFHDRWKPATNEEVFEALKNEAVKMGFENRTYIIDCNGVEMKPCGDFVFRDNVLYFGGGVVFLNGKWATIIPTLTKKEAEEKFNIKINIF